MADDSDLIRRANSLLNAEAAGVAGDRREGPRRIGRRRSFIASTTPPETAAGAAPPTPALAQLVTDDVNAGKVLYMVRCTECHNLGKVVETPVIKQQGPDLIRVAERIDYTWAQRWITDPKKIDPNTKMTVPGLSPKEVDQVRAFVWWSSLTELGKTAAR